MGGGWQFKIADKFVDELRALAPEDQALVKRGMREILVEPIAGKHIVPLPPPHMGGTMEAAVGAFSIRFFLDRNDDGARVPHFIRVFRTMRYPWDDDEG